MVNLPTSKLVEEEAAETSVADVISINPDVVAREDSAVELASKTKKRVYKKITLFVLLLAAVIVFLTIWYLWASPNGALSSAPLEDEQTELAGLQAELEEAQVKQLNASEALVTQEAELADLKLELAETKGALALAIDPEVVQLLEAQLEEQTELTVVASGELAKVKAEAAKQADELALQTQIATQSQLDLEAEAAARADAEVQANRAQARAEAETVRADQAQAVSAVEVGLIPKRVEGMFNLLSDANLLSTTYDLGEVIFELRPPGPFNDETQRFVGTGTIGYESNLDSVIANWLRPDVLQVILPLPKVEASKTVQLVGEITIDRQQFNRIGGRWGELTELFVEGKARTTTRELACDDSEALRGLMSQLKQMAYQLGQGYSVNIRWVDSKGFVRSNVSDALLLNNAC